jgi:fatty-acyl-CoA synthase
MDTQEIDLTIKRARRNTIGDAVRRSAARNPEKDAIIFRERRWRYAEVDAGANRVANALLAQGLEKGDRVAAYGMNSDAYVLLWLGCSRAGLIHVPVNFHLAGDELLYILNQSGSKALFHDPGFEANVEEVRDEAEAEIHGTLYDGDGLDVVGLARSRCLRARGRDRR